MSPNHPYIHFKCHTYISISCLFLYHTSPSILLPIFPSIFSPSTPLSLHPYRSVTFQIRLPLPRYPSSFTTSPSPLRPTPRLASPHLTSPHLTSPHITPLVLLSSLSLTHMKNNTTQSNIQHLKFSFSNTHTFPSQHKFNPVIASNTHYSNTTQHNTTLSTPSQLT